MFDFNCQRDCNVQTIWFERSKNKEWQEMLFAGVLESRRNHLLDKRNQPSKLESFYTFSVDNKGLVGNMWY